MVGIDVVGLQADAGLAVARRRARGRRGEGDGGHLVARRHLDPTVAVAERHVDALLEAERLDIELDRTVLIGHRDNDRADLVDASPGVGHDILLGVGITPAETAHHSALPGHVGLISMLVGRKLKWDPAKEHFVGDAEVDKLLRHGDGWLGKHPERQLIVSRYLKRRTFLMDQAFAQPFFEQR